MPLSEAQKLALAKGRAYRIAMYKGLREIKRRTKTTKKQPKLDLRDDKCAICYEEHHTMTHIVLCPVCVNWFCSDCVINDPQTRCALCSTGHKKDFVIFHKKK